MILMDIIRQMIHSERTVEPCARKSLCKLL